MHSQVRSNGTKKAKRKPTKEEQRECQLEILMQNVPMPAFVLWLKMVEMGELKILGKCSKSVSAESNLINDFTGLLARNFFNIIFFF